MEGTGGFELAETEAQRQTRSQKTRAQKDEHNKRCVLSRKKKKMRFEELEQTETKYKEMVPEFKRLEEEVPKLQAENKKADLELEEMKSKLRANENELQEAKRNFMAQKENEEWMRGLLLDVIQPNGKSFTSVEKLQEWFVSQTYVPDHQVSTTSAILQNVDESERLGGNGAANFQPSMAYLHMGSGQDYSKNVAYAALGPSSVANPGNHLGVMTVPESLAEYSVSDPSNNLENYVKGKSSTSVDKSRGLFPSQNYVLDSQVSAASATGLQNVDGFVQTGLNGTASFGPSMAYQQMGSGHDYSKNAAYAALGPSSVANPGNHLGVMTVPESLAEYSVSDPSNNLENYVKGKVSTSVDESRGLFPSQNYVLDSQVSAASATGLQNVDGFVQSGLNGTANIQPSMAYQQMGSGQDYSKDATYTVVAPSSVANHGNHLGVMTVPESLAEYSVSDPSNNLENYVKGKSSTSVDKSRGLFPSQNYVLDSQVSAASATGLQNVDGFVQSGLNGTTSFRPSMAYPQMGSGQDYSMNAAYGALGPSSVANPGNHLGVLAVPESLADYSVSDPSNNLENYVKRKSSTSVDKSRGLFPSKNYVLDSQVSAASATGLQNVDGFVQSGLNGTANIQPSMAYQQMGSGQDYSKNAIYTAVGPSFVANHGVMTVPESLAEYSVSDPPNNLENYVKGKSSTSFDKSRGLFPSQNYVLDSQVSAASTTGLQNVDGFVQSGLNGSANFRPSMAYQQIGSGVLAVASSLGENPEMLCDPANIPKSYDDHSSRRWY